MPTLKKGTEKHKVSKSNIELVNGDCSVRINGKLYPCPVGEFVSEPHKLEYGCPPQYGGADERDPKILENRDLAHKKVIRKLHRRCPFLQLLAEIKAEHSASENDKAKVE